MCFEKKPTNTKRKFVAQQIILIEINMYTGKLNKTFKVLNFIRTYIPTVLKLLSEKINTLHPSQVTSF